MTCRKFLLAAAASCAASGAPRQPFTAGTVPAGRSSPTDQVATFWSHCDEVAGLGFHHIEFNNTGARIAEYYANRARIACLHLKDFTPRSMDGNAPKAGNAPFGEGSVDLAGVIQLLREMDLGGFVMSESGGMNEQMRDYMVHALGLSI